MTSPKAITLKNRGDWDKNLITFGPDRPIKLESVERTPTSLYLVYDFGDMGHWEFVIESEKVSIERI